MICLLVDYFVAVLVPISPLEIDRDALPLRVTVEHSLERIFAPHSALLEASVRLAGELTESLVNLHPARLDRMRGVERLADVARPHVRSEAVMAVVRHADRLALVVT